MGTRTEAKRLLEMFDPDGVNVVEMYGVTHNFGRTRALDDLYLRVPSAAITVLLGPNGAGKTTTIRAMTGAIRPAEGLVTTFGTDPASEDNRVRSLCGVVSAKPALYDRLSGYDNLRFAAQLYGITEDVDAHILDAAERFGIIDSLDKQVGGYSTGMKTRLALSRSILHDPLLLLFDEPTSGLDPESSVAVLDLIKEIALDGSTVVMGTHLLTEADCLADHVVIMDEGRAVVEGSADGLTSEYWPFAAVILDAVAVDQLDRTANMRGVTLYERLESGGVYVELDDDRRIPRIVADLVADGVGLTRVEPIRPTLEDLYFAVRRASSSPDAVNERGNQLPHPTHHLASLRGGYHPDGDAERRLRAVARTTVDAAADRQLVTRQSGSLR